MWWGFLWHGEENIDVLILCTGMVYIWNIRNRLVFENKSPDWELEKRQIKLRWGFWMNGQINRKNL